ncbi:hypothetical protein CAZ03_34900 [Pseudomonas aeruginosa]|nr:hypothetical protein CAZ03_34900 [Pseudomonas aeruginosa]
MLPVKNLFVLYTGGTIGMLQTPQGLSLIHSYPLLPSPICYSRWPPSPRKITPIQTHYHS